VLIRALVTAAVLGLLVPATASAGTFSKTDGGATIVYTPTTDTDVDQITGFETATSFRFTRFGGTVLGQDAGCVLVPNDVTFENDTVDCPKSGIRLIRLDLGGGDDVATISPSVTIPVEFNGGAGRDGLFGSGGTDVFEGGPGADNVVSRDGRAEDVDCGDGLDTAISDDADTRRSCEQVEGDADGDGVRVPSDCDDTRPGIRPGVADVPENGIDEDCSGADAAIADRDGDGTPVPQDCNDTDAGIEPGGREVAGNGVDENCDGRIEPLRPIGGTVTGVWRPVGSRFRNVSLVARGFPAQTVIRVRCRGGGCRSGVTTRRVRTRRRPVDLHGILGERTYARGVRIELSFSRSERVGRVLRYVIRRSGPEVEFLCQAPGAAAGPC
jgi:hypothetical protein